MDKRVNFRAPTWLRGAVKAKALSEGTNISTVARRALYAYLNGNIDIRDIPEPPDTQPSN